MIGANSPQVRTSDDDVLWVKKFKAPSGAVVKQVMSHFVIGTAGHIDHGKTLVQALTGQNTDRLKEEKARDYH